MEYSWTKLGQKQSIRYPNGTIVQYTYDDNRNLQTVTDTDGGVTRYDYHEENRQTAQHLPNGATSLEWRRNYRDPVYI